MKIAFFLKCKTVTLPSPQVLSVLALWLIRWVIGVALIGIIKAALSLLTGYQPPPSKLPSEDLFKIKDTMEKKDSPLTYIIITTLYGKR